MLEETVDNLANKESEYNTHDNFDRECHLLIVHSQRTNF